MKYRCPYCRRLVLLDPGAATYVAGQVYAHSECCAKRPEATSPDDLYTTARQITRRISARARRRAE